MQSQQEEIIEAIRVGLRDLSNRWGAERNYSWTITPGQQADIVLLVRAVLEKEG